MSQYELRRHGVGALRLMGVSLAPVLALAVASTPLPAFSQEPVAAAAQAAAATRSFQIPAGALADALDAFGEQSGLQILYRPELAENIGAAALQGEYGIEDALRILLAGTGLSYHFLGNDTVALRAAVKPEASSAPVSPVAEAQAETAQLAPRGIEEIVVTARRREERQQDVPVAITALSGSFLEENSIAKLSDLNAYVPALQVDNFNSPTSTNLGVRGVRSTDIAPGQDSAVGVYFGEVNYGYTVGISQLMFDLQTVEVLKGPQGTLFGRNSTGGAMLLTPAKPVDDFDYSLTAGTTFFDGGSGYSGSGMINIPVASSLSLRAGFSFIDRDGYVENRIDRNDPQSFQANPSPNFGVANGERLNADRSMAWRIGALWTPSGSVESYFMYQGVHVDTSGIGYAVNALNPASPLVAVYNGQNGTPSAADNFNRIRDRQSRDFWTAESNIGSFVKLDMHALSNATTWNISDQLTLKNVIGYRYYDRHDNIDFDGMPLSVLEVQHPDTGREFSEEIQLQGRSESGMIDWVAGLYYSEQDIDRRSSQVIFGGDEQFTWVDSNNRSMAAFGQVTAKVPAVEGLSVTGGLRYTRDRREMLNRRFFESQCALFSAGQRLPQDECGFFGETQYGEFTYSANVDYKIDRDTLVYLAHRRGYRAGGFDYAAANQEIYGPFSPEFVTDFELGLKKDWRLGDSFLRTNVAFYHQKYDDIQRFILREDQPAASVTNAASASISGGELELTLIPFDGLDLSAFYALVVAGYDDFGEFSDNEFAQVPRHQYSLSARYRLPLSAEIGDIRARADWSYRSHVYYVDTAQGDGFGPHESQGQDGYGLLNLGLSWGSVMRSSFDASLFVRNATNRETRPFGVQLYNSLGYNISTIGDPRVVGFELTYRFK